MTTSATPVSGRERIYTLDVIRGVALLGIFIMNMPSFNTSFYAGTDGTELWPAWWDEWTRTTTEVLFSGKFNSMFSMLFAIGFTIQLGRLESRDPGHAKSIYLRRIFWLFVFGAIHMCVFWTGDVLHMYAMFGVVLLALRRVPEKLLWALFAGCLLLPVAMMVHRLLTFVPADREIIVAGSRLMEASNNLAYGQGSFLDALREHTRETIHLYTTPWELRGLVNFYAQIFATMILGLILGRRQFFQDTEKHLPFVRRIQWIALAGGIAAGAVFAIWENTTTDFVTPTPFRLFAGICYWVCRVLVMIFYVATLIRCVHNPAVRPKLNVFATAGRMPLTNYLMQTAIATTLFYGWGFGLWGKVGPALDLLLAVTIYFAIQVPVSAWWLKRFELGPMEYLWRRLTYGHATLRRAPGAVTPAAVTPAAGAGSELPR
ncbi:MAG TPA: DUF418 domain-containing protein [Steroidobacteraceae bacterium]|nr:DUF418 domain-containing protein [Steroidobacteraceae bacterium]